jgi:hypothetical protein
VEVYTLSSRFGATFEVTSEEIAAYCEWGNARFEAAIALVEAAAGRVRPSVTREGVTELRWQQRNWNLWSDLEREGSGEWRKSTVERVILRVVFSGRGVVTCPECDDLYPGSALSVQVSRWDGIMQEWYQCPRGHDLLITNENRMGEMDDDNYGWTPVAPSDSPISIGSVPEWKFRKWQGLTPFPATKRSGGGGR